MRSRLISVVLSLWAMHHPAAQADDTVRNAPDVIYYNGKIFTLDAAQSIGGAVAVKNGQFQYVGATAETLKMAGPATQLVDLQGLLAVPGLIDAHAHPMETAMVKETWVDARFPETQSVAQALDKIRARVLRTPRGEWIYVACVSASQNKFDERRLPTKQELDAIAPEHPLVVANGMHMGVLNSAALAALGVTAEHPQLPGGGHAQVGKDGALTGILTDPLNDLPFMPKADDMKRYFGKSVPDLWTRYGFTSVFAMAPGEAMPALKEVARQVRPNIRYTIATWTSANAANMPENLDAYKMPASADPDYYRFAAIKMWMDGENDARTGYMYSPYEGHFDTDPPGGRGALVATPAQAQRFLDIAERNGVVPIIHCSGDDATDRCLDLYEQSAAARAQKRAMRISHFGMFQLGESQLERAAALKKQGLFIDVHPTWLLTLAKANRENIGDRRADTGFAFRSMIEAGLEPAGGTDTTGIYLTSLDPMRSIYAAVTRNSDLGLYQPEQAISVTDALRMWTIWSARALGEEAMKGSIEVGKFADMTVLSADILSIPKENLKDVRIVKTIVGGRIVYEAQPER